MSCDIVMGNVKPLLKEIASLKEKLAYLEQAQKVLDKAKYYDINTYVEGDYTELPSWSFEDI